MPSQVSEVQEGEKLGTDAAQLDTSSAFLDFLEIFFLPLILIPDSKFFVLFLHILFPPVLFFFISQPRDIHAGSTGAS